MHRCLLLSVVAAWHRVIITFYSIVCRLMSVTVNSPVDWSCCALEAAQRPLDSHTRMWVLPARHTLWAGDTCPLVRRCRLAATLLLLLSTRANRPAACPPDDADDVLHHHHHRRDCDHHCDCGCDCYGCGCLRRRCCRCCDDDVAAAVLPVWQPVAVHPVAAVMVGDKPVVLPTMVVPHWLQQRQQQPQRQH